MNISSASGNPASKKKAKKEALAVTHKASLGNRKAFRSKTNKMRGCGDAIQIEKMPDDKEVLQLLLACHKCCKREKCIYKYCFNAVTNVADTKKFRDILFQCREKIILMTDVEKRMFLIHKFKEASSSAVGTSSKIKHVHSFTVEVSKDYNNPSAGKELVPLCREAWGVLHGFSVYSLDQLSAAIKLDKELLFKEKKEAPFKDDTIIPLTYDQVEAVFKHNLGENYGKFKCLNAEVAMFCSQYDIYSI